MSRKIHPAPFALATDGSVLISLGEFDGPRSLSALLERAQKQGGAVFIGVQLSDREIQNVLVRVHEGCTEAAAFIAGARQKK